MTKKSTVKALEPLYHVLGTTERYSVDCRGLLRAGEMLTGTPTITAYPNNVTISSPAVNSAAFDNDEGQEVAAGEGVELTVSGGSAGRYQLLLIVPREGGGGLTTGGILELIIEAPRPG